MVVISGKTITPVLCQNFFIFSNAHSVPIPYNYYLLPITSKSPFSPPFILLFLIWGKKTTTKQPSLKQSRTLWALPPTVSLAGSLSVENFSQRISLIREVRNVETKENSQRRLNNNDIAIWLSQGPLVFFKGFRSYSEPYRVSCLMDTETRVEEVSCVMSRLCPGHELPQFPELVSEEWKQTGPGIED